MMSEVEKIQVLQQQYLSRMRHLIGIRNSDKWEGLNPIGRKLWLWAIRATWQDCRYTGCEEEAKKMIRAEKANMDADVEDSSDQVDNEGGE